MLVCLDPEIQKKGKRRHTIHHKIIQEAKAVHMSFPALHGLPGTGESEQEPVSLQV